MHRSILLIDDDPRHAKAFEEALFAREGGPSNFEWVRTLSSGLATLAHKEALAIFFNLSLLDSRGIDTLDRLLSVASTTPVIIFAGVDDEEICKTAMLHGARDYFLEDRVDSNAFTRAMRNIVEREVAQHELFIEKGNVPRSH